MDPDSQNPLLSTQIGGLDPYGVFDSPQTDFQIAPKPWYPQSPARYRALFSFYFLAMSGTIASLIWPAIRYKRHPIFIDVKYIEWGWLFVYFSYWVQALQAFFFLYAIFDLLTHNLRASRFIHGFKERLYDATFSLTFLSVIVFSAFVFPERLKHVGEQTLTWEVWVLDILTGIVPMLLIIIETVVVHHRFAETICRFIYEVFLPLVIFGIYTGFSYYAYHKNQHWPYPYQNTIQNQHLRHELKLSLFFVAGFMLVLAGYILAKALTKLLWTDHVPHNTEEMIFVDDNTSFNTYSVFHSFINSNVGSSRYKLVPNTPQQTIGQIAPGSSAQSNEYSAQSLVGSPQPAYNGYGTVDYQNKGYY